MRHDPIIVLLKPCLSRNVKLIENGGKTKVYWDSAGLSFSEVEPAPFISLMIFTKMAHGLN